MFKEIKVTDLSDNFIKSISDEWMLISAGDEKKFNMMTASWGFMGHIWNKHAAIILLRPNRYTKKFVDENEFFALSFYGEEAKSTIHKVCGSMSGRDVDKAALTGLTPVFSDNTVYFEQARLVIICKKIYVDEIKPECEIDKSIENHYNNDHHTFYIGEIVKCFVKA